MKFLMINVSKKWQGRVYKEYPHGVGILATIASEAGHDVHILDMALDERSVEDVVKEFEPNVIGLSFFSPSAKEAYNLIEELKVYYQGHLIAGGIHSTLYPIEVVKQGVDLVVVGEGELTLLKILSYLEKRKKRDFDYNLDEIPNIYYGKENGDIIFTHKSNESVDLNEIPMMNRELFNEELYSHHSILTSRGCPYRCKFCCSWAPGGKSGRIMKPERIMRELEDLVCKYGKLNLYWADEIFFWNAEQRLEFCELLYKKNLPIDLTIQIRADLITDELIKAFKKAKCNKICIGAEAGSDEILKNANKKVKSKDLENALKICAKYKMRTKTWWIIGLPGAYEEQLKTIELIERTRPNEVAVHQFVPLPGSVFWENADEYGIQFPEDNIFDNLSYYSDGKNFKFDYISNEEIQNLLNEFEIRLKKIGYIPTDLADENSEYIYTSPAQKTTFKI